MHQQAAPPNSAAIGCPHCGNLLANNPALAGQNVTCPYCQGVMLMPAAPSTPLAPVPRPAPARPPVRQKASSEPVFSSSFDSAGFQVNRAKDEDRKRKSRNSYLTFLFVLLTLKLLLLMFRLMSQQM